MIDNYLNEGTILVPSLFVSERFFVKILINCRKGLDFSDKKVYNIMWIVA